MSIIADCAVALIPTCTPVRDAVIRLSSGMERLMRQILYACANIRQGNGTINPFLWNFLMTVYCEENAFKFPRTCHVMWKIFLGDQLANGNKLCCANDFTDTFTMTTNKKLSWKFSFCSSGRNFFCDPQDRSTTDAKLLAEVTEMAEIEK
jgi:hypothetical protein